MFQPFPKGQILDSSKLKEFADNNFKFDEIGSKFSKCVGSNVGKGEIARYEPLLLFPQCFQRLLCQTRKNQDLFGKGFKNAPGSSIVIEKSSVNRTKFTQ